VYKRNSNIDSDNTNHRTGNAEYNDASYHGNDNNGGLIVYKNPDVYDDDDDDGDGENPDVYDDENGGGGDGDGDDDEDKDKDDDEGEDDDENENDEDMDDPPSQGI
jgi:hypothetical protein